MKDYKVKVLVVIITILILIVYCFTYSYGELSELEKQATDLNHNGKIDQRDVDLIVHQPYPEMVLDGVEAPNEDAYYIFRQNAAFVDADDYMVDTTQSDSSLVITDEEKLKKAVKALYTGKAQKNLLSVIKSGTFLKIQEDYNVNAVFTIAVTIAESSGGSAWGAIPEYTHNWMSVIGSYKGKSVPSQGSNPRWWRVYDSFEEATLDFGDLIANSAYYFQNGRYTVKEIAIPYCDTRWGEFVVSEMSRIYSAMGISASNSKRTSFDANGDILKAADQVHQDEITWTYYSNTSQLTFNDIEGALNNPNKVTCCATYVSCVLYVAGCFTEDEFNKECEGYNSCSGLYNFLEKKGWTRINSYDELQAGDVVWERK